MKTKFTRSLIENSLEEARDFIKFLKIALPPYSNWTVKDWDEMGEEATEVKDCLLGWDVTDFGHENFHEIGRVLFTLRNGKSNSVLYPKGYAEKIIFDPEGQRAPLHYHLSKREDIINRGGGNILVQLSKANPDSSTSNESFFISVNGIQKKMASREIIRLTPGESLCIPPLTLHQFWAEEGKGMAVSGEVSSVCDDWNDNVFVGGGTRFPQIVEDVEKKYYLCHEYPDFKK